jgi:uncharacterized protein (TIRG00374 family)
VPLDASKKTRPRLKKIELIFFALGLCALLYLLHRFGFETLLKNLAATGWTFGVIILLWGFIFLLNTTAWKLVLGLEGEAMSFPQLYRITVSGFALNDVTPFLAIGGEPYRMSILAEKMGRGRSVSAVTLYRMIYSLGHILLLLTGVVLSLLTLKLSSLLTLLLSAAGLVLSIVVMLIVSAHREGIFERVFALLQRVSPVRRLLERFSVNQASLKRMDELVTNAYRKRKSDFYGAISLEFLSRCCMGLEIYLILRSVGVRIEIPEAFFLYVVYSLLINILFAVPYNVGVREGGFYFALQSLALPPMIGVYLGIVMRIREFFWVFLGLLFIVVGSARRPSVPSSG